MDWKHVVHSRKARLTHKRVRRLSGGVQRCAAALLLAGGWPRPLARFLRERELTGELVLCKDGILHVAAGDRFLRYAARARPRDKLRREFAGWRQLKVHGLGPIVQRTLELHALTVGLVLEADLLRPIDRADQMAASLPIIKALAAAARPVAAAGLPATVEAGLALARSIAGGRLPETFAAESDIHDCFARPLLTGVSHEDLHFRNVMREGDGRPVLIDLKSCVLDRVLALDLLTFACKHQSSRDGRNVIDQALAAQARAWRLPELEPALALIDLPRPLWGPVFVLHALGRVWLRRKPDMAIHPPPYNLLSDILARDWRAVA